MNYRRLAVLSALATGLCLQPACASSSADKEPDGRPALTEAPADEEAGGEEASDAEESEEAGEPDAEESAQAEKGDDGDDGEKPTVHAVGRVAVIDGEDISAEEFNDAARKAMGSMGQNMPARMAAMIKTRTLDRLIDEHLIDRELERHADQIEVSDAEFDAELDKFRARFPDANAFHTFLERNGVTEDELHENLRKDLALRKLLRKKYGLSVTPEEAREYYNDNIKRFEEEEQVRARHILIKVSKNASEDEVLNARLQAEELSEKARQSDVDFAKLARRHSQGPTAARGGDLGYFTKDRMVPEFAKVAFSTAPGTVSDPVRSAFGFHVILVEDHKKAGTKPFSEAEEEILSQLKRQQFRAAMREYLGDLKANANIERFEDNIEVNVSEEQPPTGSLFGMPPESQEKLEKELHQELQRQGQEERLQQQQRP